MKGIFTTFLFVVAYGFGWTCGDFAGRTQFQNEAMEHGAGHDDPETGQWVWTGSGKPIDVDPG